MTARSTDGDRASNSSGNSGYLNICLCLCHCFRSGASVSVLRLGGCDCGRRSGDSYTRDSDGGASHGVNDGCGRGR